MAFAIADDARLTASAIGAEREPLLDAAGLLADPAALVDVAAASRFTPAYGPTGGYPGLRAALPDAYIQSVVDVLVGPIAEAFGLGAVRPNRAQGAFSLVTLAPTALAPPQRSPHVDSVDPAQFAILHYLCDAGAGGTAFYRHKATGFELLDDCRLASYRAARATEAAPHGYVDDGAPWFERTMQVGAAFNRVIVYRSCILHSGTVPTPDRLTADPRSGRLTANIFLTLASG
jgi:hypothetical protein